MGLGVSGWARGSRPEWLSRVMSGSQHRSWTCQAVDLTYILHRDPVRLPATAVERGQAPSRANSTPQSLRDAHADAAVQPRPQAPRPPGALQEPSLSPVLAWCCSPAPREQVDTWEAGVGGVVVHASGGLHSQPKAVTTFCVCRQTEHQSISGLCHESREKSAPSQEPCEGCGWRRAGDGCLSCKPRPGEVQALRSPGPRLCGCLGHGTSPPPSRVQQFQRWPPGGGLPQPSRECALTG